MMGVRHQDLMAVTLMAVPLGDIHTNKQKENFHFQLWTLNIRFHLQADLS